MGKWGDEWMGEWVNGKMSECGKRKSS